MALDETIEELASQPKRVAGDAGSVEMQSLDDVIKADKHLAEKEAVATPHRGLSFTRLVPPGAS